MTFTPSTIYTGCLLRIPQVLTSGTSYSKPTGCRGLLVELLGGGGGGGSAATAAVSAAAAGGGAAGSYARKFFDVSTDAGPFTYAIGGGGAGGNVANGDNGGNTTFLVGATTVTATGGLGGTREASAGTGVKDVTGGASTIATNGDLNCAGEPGGFSRRSSGTIATSGRGGSSAYGDGGQPRISTSGTGDAGSGFGSGGAGALVLNGAAAQIGGAGAGGFIIVWEFS